MIKKHNSKNNYYFAKNNLWVRDFTKKNTPPIDINNLISESDMNLMLLNETANKLKMLQKIDTESFTFKKIVIIGNGFDFEKEQEFLKNLPEDVILIGVNESLKLWNIARKMHFYVVNNPYEECKYLLPETPKAFPRCIASCRTNPEFINKFQGLIYEYTPTPNQNYSGLRSDNEYFIDDYRNPFCAAIHLAYIFNVKKLLLFCVDDVFLNERVGSVKLSNNSYCYPQQIIAHNLVDASLYWLRQQEIQVSYYSYYPEYNNATYIKTDEFAKFFND